jgi:hypothetical protein
LENAPCDRDGTKRLARRMGAPQGRKRGVIERLYAERHTVDSGRPVTGETLSFYAGWISLQRHLDIIGNVPVIRHRIEN